jgi:hypothetical protein
MMMYDLKKVFDDAYYPFMHAPNYIVDVKDHSIIAKQRGAEAIAKILWEAMKTVLTYDNQAHVIYRMIDIVQPASIYNPLAVAVNMVIQTYNAEHNFGDNSELRIDPII